MRGVLEPHQAFGVLVRSLRAAGSEISNAEIGEGGDSSESDLTKRPGLQALHHASMVRRTPPVAIGEVADPASGKTLRSEGRGSAGERVPDSLRDLDEQRGRQRQGGDDAELQRPKGFGSGELPAERQVDRGCDDDH
jgi:hypothetical protein